MNFEVNHIGKIELLDREGEIVLFDHAIDAMESLSVKGEDGEKMYFLPTPEEVVLIEKADDDGPGEKGQTLAEIKAKAKAKRAAEKAEVQSQE
jgi:hypothetical protein